MREPTAAELEAAFKYTLEALIRHRAEKEARGEEEEEFELPESVDLPSEELMSALDQLDWCVDPVDRALDQAVGLTSSNCGGPAALRFDGIHAPSRRAKAICWLHRHDQQWQDFGASQLHGNSDVFR
jgi:hypothetical protein